MGNKLQYTMCMLSNGTIKATTYPHSFPSFSHFQKKNIPQLSNNTHNF